MVVPLVIAGIACTLLRADDSIQTTPDGGRDVQAACTYLWYIENYTEIANSPDAMGVQAVLKATDMIKGENAEQQAEFFTKAMYNTKSHAVARICHMQLYELYKTSHPDKAMEQLQMLITEQPQ
ncbi:MAG: hypothetical protein M3O30_08590 [Planctomycetota bacterium]|nr:hypothetical protein [Planctomycetota bacterium]